MPGLIQRYTHWLHTQWPAGTVEKLPASGEDGVTNLPGVRIVGDLTGIPLLKFSSDTGASAVRAILREPDFQKGEGEILDLAIIGAGVAGISAAIEARKAGLNFVVIEATEIFSTVVNFPKAKPIYTYPTEMKLEGGLQFTADVKEALLEEMEEQRRAAGIEITPGGWSGSSARMAQLILHMGEGEPLRARRVIVAIGRSGNFRKLGVPGEELDKVSQPALRSEGICGEERARGGRRRFRFGNGDRADEVGRGRDAELSRARNSRAPSRRTSRRSDAGGERGGRRAGGAADLGARE